MLGRFDVGEGACLGIGAGALKEPQRGLMVGTKAFDKGSLWSILPMKNGAALKLTTARYYTPNNHSIQATGIQPDIVSRQLELATSPEPARDGIRESDLAGHLENENGAASETVDETTVAERLQDRDFEIGEALNLLKGMVIARRQVDQ